MIYKPGCDYCDWAERGLPGGWLHEGNYWCIGSYAHQIMPGIVLQLRRHSETVGDIRGPEWAEFGPMVGAVSRAIEGCANVERVYVVSFCEDHRHRHFLVTPLAPHVAKPSRGWHLFDHVVASKGQYDPLAAPGVRARVADSIKTELGLRAL